MGRYLLGLSIIINHPQQDLTSIAENLKNIFKSDFILKNELQSSLELIRLLPALQMVIISHPDPKSTSVKEVIHFLQTEKKSIPLIIIGKGGIPDHNYTEIEILNIPHIENKELIIETIAHLLGISIKKIKSAPTHDTEAGGEYVAISIKFMMKNSYSFFDLFQKQEVGDNNIYNKIALPAESREEILISLMERGIEELYVVQKDYDKILAIKETLPDEEDNSHSIFDEDKDLAGLNIKEQKREEILAGLKKVGISPHTFDIVNDHINKLFNRVEKI